jgi:arginase family enzyme
VSDDPNWPRAKAWLAGDHHPEPVARLAVMGVPLHLGSITETRADIAPAAVREALTGFSVWDGEGDLRRVAVRDLGDLGLADSSPEDAVSPVMEAMAGAEADAVVLLGGDNSITRPGVHGLDLPFDRVGLLTLDAHFDLRDTAAGMLNGNPVRARLEDGLPGENIAQVGIQPFANSPEYAAVARDAGIAVVPAEEVRARGIEAAVAEALARLEERAEAIYVDLDVDVLDRAFAPACPGARPGGLTPSDLNAAARLAGAHPKVRAVDLVEVDPTEDVAAVTVLATAAALLSFAAGLATRPSSGR